MNFIPHVPILLATYLLAFTSAGAILPLRDQWRLACDQMASGDAATALASFREFDHWYGQEALVREPDFQSRYLRFRGLTALQSGAVEEGLVHLEKWLVGNGPDRPHQAFLRFQVARGYQLSGKGDLATRHWEKFLSEHPDLPEVALVHWLWAEHLLAENRPGDAGVHLQAVRDNPRLPRQGKTLAEAGMALIELSKGNHQKAYQGLSGLNPGEDDPILHLWKATLAPALAGGLLDALPQEAEYVIPWFDRPENLHRILQSLEDSMSPPIQGHRDQIWHGHWRNQLERLKGALQQSGESGLMLQNMQALSLRALLKAGQPGRVLTLVRFLLESRHVKASTLRVECYRSGIEACLQLEDWFRADELADAFVEAYPEDPGLPEILFLKARTAAERGRQLEAAQQADQVAALYPDHSSAKAWQLTAAGWLLDGGEPREALERLKRLESIVPASWRPYTQLQQARCLEACGNPTGAIALLEDVCHDTTATLALREQAYTAKLKAHLRQWQEPEFLETLSQYRRQFSNGSQHPTVDTLAGTFYRMRGEVDQAIGIFSRIAKGDGEVADFAHGQLSLIHQELNDYPTLRHHALTWIEQALGDNRPVPRQALVDCLVWQEALKQPALPLSLFEQLVDAFRAEREEVPATELLSLLENRWGTFSEWLGTSLSFELWLGKVAEDARQAGQEKVFANSYFFLADRLDQQGRHDSADTKRIEVLQSINPVSLEAKGLFQAAVTADRYDFPEGETLLRRFLDRFPDSPQRPDSLYRLALKVRPAESGAAIPLLREIHTKWPDAPVHREATLALAEWVLEDEGPAAAIGILNDLLDRPDLAPEFSAQALLLRARADFHSGNDSRGRLGCERILALYPAFEAITQMAQSLLDSVAHDEVHPNA